MKDVASGVKPKQTVLAECVDQMQLLYEHVAEKQDAMVSYLNQSIVSESKEMMEDDFQEAINSPFPELPP